MSTPPEKLTTSDGLNLQIRYWPADAPRAEVMLVHGLAEHMARYDHVASAFNAAGLSVIGIDHRMHGQSDGEHRAFVPEIETLVDDLEVLWGHLDDKLPRFVMGHSMGGLVAALFALRHQEQIHGLILSAAGLMVRYPLPGPVVSLADRLGSWMPRLPLVSLSPKDITRSPETAAAYKSDPLIDNSPVRMATARSILVGGRTVLEQAHTLTLPTLMLHGGSDKIVSPASSKRLAAALSSPDKTLKIYPGLRHEILNEPEKEAVIRDILDWLNAHLSA